MRAPIVMSNRDSEVEKLNASIAALETQRAALGSDVIDPAIAALRQQLSQLHAAAEKQTTEDERKIVTIVFADISGFTALSEKKDPEEVRELMNACFESLVPVVQKYEGTIDKFIGDEIMALFGAPIAHEDDPERALRAGLEMMGAIAGINRTHGTELGLHIGINSGPVIAGQVGAENRRDYSVMGDAVNLAARLEDASSSGEIFVGPSTYQQTAHLFEFEKIPPLTLKGKEAPVQVHRLLRAKTVAKSRRGIEGLHTDLVGRDSELDRIRTALNALQRGRGSICAVFGEAGVGKSRLVAETRAAAAHNFRWAEGRSLSYTARMSYWLARAVLYDLLEIESEAVPAAATVQLKNALEKELPENFADIYPYLARLFELPLDEAMQERVNFLSTEALQARILQAVQDFIRARAKREALVLIWEDMHWADPSSLEVFESLLTLVKETPLLFICLARPDDNPGTDLLKRIRDDYPSHYQRIELSPLTREQSRSLIDQLLKIDNLQENIRNLILDRAEGNPFFLEELVRSLIDAGVLIAEQNRLVATREIKAVDVPETLQSTLMTRIDRLKPQIKFTLQRASVIGRVFQERVLARLHEHGTNGTRLAESLGELRRREFVRLQEATPAEQADQEYLFKHAITHDVAYNSMLLARRKELHKLVAEALEQLFPERLEDLSATLGYHFERAEAHEPAAKYLGSAADRAKATFANTEAIGFYESAIRAIERVLKSSDRPEHRENALRLNEGLGDLLTLTGEHDQARAVFNRALSFVSTIDIVGRARLYRKIGFSHSLQRNYRATEEAFSAADFELEKVTTERDAVWWEEKVQIQLERMHLFYWQGMVPEMVQLADRYGDAVATNATAIQRSKFLKLLALSQLMGSRFRPSKECVQLAERAVAESADIPNLSEKCHTRFSLGLIQLWRCNLEEATTHGVAALELAERVGDLVLEARCLTYLAVSHRRAGNVERAREFANRTLALASKLQMVEYVAMAKANLAWIAWKEERLDDCETLAREALELWHGMEDPLSMDWMALWPLIGTALTRKQTEHAVKFAEGLFPDSQHPVDDEVMSATRQAIDSWRKGEAEVAAAQMQTALQTAGQHRYI
jgi:predicted ATPase/class 3 adenylate cyclase